MIYTTLPRNIIERSVDVKLEKAEIVRDKTNFVDIFEVVKKKNYSELEEIKASLRVHMKKSECKANKLMLVKWIIEIEDKQGIKY